jgi:predicted transglutaminase-like cysteine proteinase
MSLRSWCGLALCVAFPVTGALAAEARPAVPPPRAMSGPDILGTVAVPIRADRFGDSLKRAREDASRSPELLRLILAARPLPPLQQLLFIQRAVNARIHWMSDATEWGQHDYWASAAQTLSRGAGDMEDRAIVKLQALRALGFSNSDLFLTLARDRVAGPLTVLTVRTGGRYYVLDDSAAAPFPAEERRFELQPIMSFGLYGAWVHVRPAAIASAGGASSALARK